MKRHPPVLVRLATVMFALATSALPSKFRRGFGQDVRESFADEAHERYRDDGIPALMRVTVAALTDVARALLDIRWRRNHRPSRRTPMHAVWQDVRYGARTFVRQPGFSIAALFMLTLGIGANSAIFTLLNAAIIRPLPYPEPGRLVRVWGENVRSGDTHINVNPLDAIDWQRGAPALEAIAIWTSTTQPMTGAGDPVAIPVASVTSAFFDLLGVKAVKGRLFGPEHDRPGLGTDVVVSDPFWRRTLGADPAVVGRRITLSDVTCTIIGVLPAGFVSPGSASAVEPQVWRSFAIAPDIGRGGHFAGAIARLAPGASIDVAQQQVHAVADRLSREFPSTNNGARARLEPLQEAIAGDARPVLAVLMSAVGVVLLIACANVANLLLARGTIRQREIALRGALGASRARVVRQLMTECLLLGACAAVAGAALGAAIVEAIPTWLADQLPAVMTPRLDVRVLAFTAALSIATVLLFGLIPAMLMSRHDLRGALSAGSPGAGGGSPRLQSALLVAEAALAVVLLVAAALLVESLIRLQRTDPGFEPANMLTFRVTLARARYPDTDRRNAFFARALDRIRALPGVSAAGGVNMSPLTNRYSCDSFGLADRPAPPQGEEPCAESRVATRDYFSAMGIPLLSGRTFSSSDSRDTQFVTVISETMARRYWPDGNALGQRFKWGSVDADTPWRTVVGVVGDVKHYGLEQDAPPEVYVPIEQGSASSMTIAVRSPRDPAALASEIREAMASIDPALALFEMFTARDLMARATAVPAFRTQLLTAFAAVALILSVTGVYGVISFFVAQQKREIGIRLALGATPGGVRAYIFRRGLTSAVLGILIGLALAVPTARLLDDQLFQVKPGDPVAFTIAPLLLLGTALLACYVPARRATRFDPLVTLKVD